MYKSRARLLDVSGPGGPAGRTYDRPALAPPDPGPHVEHLDQLLTDLARGAAFPVVLGIALLLGLRHASDPDHLAAVAPLATGDPADRRRAVGLGLAWGAGHATMLALVGVPLIVLRAEVPEGVGGLLERAVGAMIVVLAALALVRWARERRTGHAGPDRPVRRLRTAYGVGVVHGLAGTGAVALLLLSLLPARGEALVALLVFAPATMASMALVTAGWTWVLARPGLARIHAAAVVPAVSIAALVFGAGYAGAF